RAAASANTAPVIPRICANAWHRSTSAPGPSWHTGDTVYRHRQPAHSSHMGEVRPIPTLGGVVRDVRGAERALRVSWHREDELVVLSLWNGPRCTGTVRVAAADVPALIEALQIGLRSQSDQSDQLPAGAAP